MRGLPGQLEDLLGNPDDNRRVIDRLFPPSYADPTEEADNRALLADGLLADRRQTLVDVRASLASGKPDKKGLVLQLDMPAMDLWLRFLNDIRLVLATYLRVETSMDERLELDPEDPDAPQWALLDYLSGLEALLVSALSGEF